MSDVDLFRRAAQVLTDACTMSAKDGSEQYGGVVKVESVRIIGGRVNWIVMPTRMAASLARLLRIQSNIEEHDPGTASPYLKAVARDIVADEERSNG